MGRSGYKCRGCGDVFWFDEYPSRRSAADAAWQHVTAHNTGNDMEAV